MSRFNGKNQPQPVYIPNIIAARTGIAIGLPFSGRGCPPEFALTLASQNYPSSIQRKTLSIKGVEVGEARCKLAEIAIEHKCKYLWFADEDLSLPPNACRQLMGTLENAHSETIAAGGIYTTKSFPCEPLVYRGKGVGPFWKWKAGDIFEVTGIATGCLLIDLEKLATLEKPWFKTVDDPVKVERQTEDLYFCDKAVNAGFRILADSNVMCVHWEYDNSVNAFVPYYLAEDSYPGRPVTEEEPRARRYMEHPAMPTMDAGVIA